jgi:Acetyltransferase (GNAT) domain
VKSCPADGHGLGDSARKRSRRVHRAARALDRFDRPGRAGPLRHCATSASRALPGGRVADGALRLDCIDFAKWPDFAAYRRAVSENLRRDYKKAAAAAPVLTTRRGMDAYRDLPALVGLRRQVMRRNDEPFSSVVDAPLHALKLWCLGDDAFVSRVEANGRAQAAFFGVRFGGGIYYVSGGTADRCEGFGSYLFLTLIERWFAEQPRGRLYLGITEPGYVPETYTGGNLLYRRKLRAVSIPGAAFTLAVG